MMLQTYSFLTKEQVKIMELQLICDFDEVDDDPERDKLIIIKEKKKALKAEAARKRKKRREKRRMAARFISERADARRKTRC